GLLQAVPMSGEIAIESTGNGVGNDYHRRVLRAYEGHSEWKCHFFGLRDAHNEYTIKLTPKEFIKWKKLGPDKIRNFLSNGHSKKLINKKDSKDVILSNLVSMIKREKDNIPMELVRGFELFFRTIKER
ncbi:hypothetical protein LCGC14_0801620, partial [marine sediment metagenome]